LLPIVIAAALRLSVAAPPARAAEPPRRDTTRAAAPSAQGDATAGYPPEHRARYVLFQKKCVKCHSESVAASSPLTPVQLKRHLKRPGVGASNEQLQAISELLKFLAARRSSR